jgi:hypothetical protein
MSNISKDPIGDAEWRGWLEKQASAAQSKDEPLPRGITLPGLVIFFVIVIWLAIAVRVMLQ